MKADITILIIDDEAGMRQMLSILLKKGGYMPEMAAGGAEGLERISRGGVDFVLCDVRMPGMDGLAFLDALHERGLSATVIMMSAYGSMDLALAAMKKGAYDYISKPFKQEEILLVLQKALERERLRRENALLMEDLAKQRADGPVLEGVVARSKTMLAVLALVDKVGPHDASVLITGESGTGKELIARGLHKKSPRATKPFVAVNCASIPETLLESVFFGHIRGAFTGADQSQKGLFEEADGGTLFLDEIGELDFGLQAKLLRVLQEKEVRRLGGSAVVKVDVRILAATAADLAALVQAGTFRDDLYYRLNVVPIHVPSLRDRREDIPILGQYFLSLFVHQTGHKVRGLSPAAIQALMRHTWPGNVRELKNVIERALILADKEIIQPEHLSIVPLAQPFPNRRIDDYFGTYSLKKAKRIMEERMIQRAMEAVGGNKSKAAEILEISYPSLLAKLKQSD